MDSRVELIVKQSEYQEINEEAQKELYQAA